MIGNKKLLSRALTAALFAVSTGAFAHTVVTDEAFEGKNSYNNLTIGHGCHQADGSVKPVVAQSVVFPSGVVGISEKTGKRVKLANVIAEGGVAGLISVIQDKNIFNAQGVKKDANGNVIGFHGTNGNLQTDLRGMVPFRFKGPTFVATSCASRLLVKVAVADICDATVFPPTPETANTWIPAATPNFPAGLDGIGAAPTLVINRTTPLPAGCQWTDSTGAVRNGWDITLTPSVNQVDSRLPIEGYWGN